MTGNSNKVRAVFLAALMIFSVFAGTVAFSGSAAAANQGVTYDGNAVHYVTDSNDGNPVVEIPMTGVVPDSGTVNGQNVKILDDGDNVTAISGYRTQNASIIVELDRAFPSNDLEVELTEGLTAGGNPITNPGEKNVVFAGQTVEHDTSVSGNTDGGSDSQAQTNTNLTAYQGVTVAVNASNLSAASADSNDLSGGVNHGLDGVSVTVEGEDNNYFREGSTGNNSTVFTFDTSDRELGQYRVYLNETDNEGNRTFINIRDLDLDVSVDDLNVSDEDTIETTVTAVSSDRNVNAELIDSNGDTLNETSATLDGQAEADIDFNTRTADDNEALETGTYTVEVTDNATGVTVGSSDITVTEANDESASFADSTITEERGDIVEATIELTETDEATLSFGSESDGVIANATVEDDNDDDQVTVYINTYQFEDGTSGQIYNLDDDSDDNIIAQEQPQTTDPIDGTTGDLVDAGSYDLEVQAGAASGVESASNVGPRITESDSVATVTLEERSTDTFRTWTGSTEAINTLNDLEDVNEALDEGQITQSSDVAAGDLVVHQLVASGFEGALDARDNEDVTNRFQTLDQQTGPINLTIEEGSPGANQDAKEVVKGYGNNVSVIADGPNDTYYVVVDTNAGVNLADDDATANNAEALPSDEDTELEANFTVLGDEDGIVRDFTTNEDDENEETFVDYTVEEPDVTISEPFNVSQASGQTISAETNIAPGTETSLRIRSDDEVSPSFLKTSDPVVQSDGTFSATFDFSEQNVGDEYTITVRSSGIILAEDEEEDGQVLEAVATDTATPTATPEPDTATPEPDTATPEPDTATPEPDTATPEPDTDTAMPDTDTPTSTPTSTPGFGVIVALTALLAAALLAVRRD